MSLTRMKGNIYWLTSAAYRAFHAVCKTNDLPIKENSGFMIHSLASGNVRNVLHLVTWYQVWCSLQFWARFTNKDVSFACD